MITHATSLFHLSVILANICLANIVCHAGKDKDSKCVDFCQVSIMDDFSLTCCILTIFNVASGIDAFVDIMSQV